MAMDNIESKYLKKTKIYLESKRPARTALGRWIGAQWLVHQLALIRVSFSLFVPLFAFWYPKNYISFFILLCTLLFFCYLAMLETMIPSWRESPRHHECDYLKKQIQEKILKIRWRKPKKHFDDKVKELRLLGALTQSSSTTTSVSIDYFFTLYSIFYVLYFINPVKFYYDISEY